MGISLSCRPCRIIQSQNTRHARFLPVLDPIFFLASKLLFAKQQHPTQRQREEEARQLVAQRRGTHHDLAAQVQFESKSKRQFIIM